MQETNSAYLKIPLGLKLMDYVHPNEVVLDDRLSLTQKRQLLCAWASDACAVESRPGFRWLPGTPGPIFVDHVFATLRTLDDLAGSPRHSACETTPGNRPFSRAARLSGEAGARSG